MGRSSSCICIILCTPNTRKRARPPRRWPMWRHKWSPPWNRMLDLCSSIPSHLRGNEHWPTSNEKCSRRPSSLRNPAKGRPLLGPAKRPLLWMDESPMIRHCSWIQLLLCHDQRCYQIFKVFKKQFFELSESMHCVFGHLSIWNRYLLIFWQTSRDVARASKQVWSALISKKFSSFLLIFN